MSGRLVLLVTDTNIWIDLANGGIITEVFQLPYKLITPDFAKKEFLNPDCRSLIEIGLEFVELEPRLVLELSRLLGVYANLSTTDLASYLLAREMKATLVTGDNSLRQMAIQNGVLVHGVLWILDEMVRLEILSSRTGAESLYRIMAQGARLPDEECKKRLDTWKE